MSLNALTFVNNTNFNNVKVAILIKNNAFRKQEIERAYVQPLVARGLNQQEIIALNLEYTQDNKAPVRLIKEHLERVRLFVELHGIQYLLVADASYFKTLCKLRKAEPHLGYVLDVSHFSPGVQAALCINYTTVFYNPTLQDKLNLGLDALSYSILGKSPNFQQFEFKDEQFPLYVEDIEPTLNKLLEKPALTCDIETYGLELQHAELASIAFAWSQSVEDGVAFPIGNISEKLLRNFFKQYRGKLIFHGSTFDTKVLIYRLFMSKPDDTVGLLTGLNLLYRDMEDTMILAYLATNSTAGNKLGLKELAFEFTGNYALEEIKDIRAVNIDKLLKYNLTDALATWYVYDKYREEVRQTQESVYQDIFKPSLKVLTQTEIIGMPFDKDRVKQVEQELNQIKQEHQSHIQRHSIIKRFEAELRIETAITATAKLKKLVKTADDFADLKFNSGSPVQLRKLMYEHLEFEATQFSDTGLPSTAGKALDGLIQTLLRQDPNNSAIKLLEDIKELQEVNKIISTFIPPFYHKSIRKNWHYWLAGNFHLGGAKSGRLSSSKPNLQQSPSERKKYGKLIKSCFCAPANWLLVGADYKSLEDRISALQTKDPNKLKVYTDGFDGHCLRAASYFKNQMPDITEDVYSINSVETKYPKLRQDSKTPTFALTYQGTWRTLVQNCGFTETEAKQIEAAYHELYQVSDAWVQQQLQKASRTGYVELAFGLRLRTPLLEQTVWGSSYAVQPYEAHQEAKTAGNALTQSYGLLTNYATNKFMKRVWESQYKYSILPIAQIHDATYFVIRDNPDILQWTNNNLIECMTDIHLPEIEHPTVKLEAELELYYPNWNSKHKIHNNEPIENISKLLTSLR